MSFDLAVWHEPDRISHQAAAEKYSLLCDGMPVATAHPSVADFYREVVGRWPELRSLDDDSIDDSVWSCDSDVSDAHVIMTFSWSRAEEVASWVRETAARHSLVLFDPQLEVVQHPARRPGGVMLATAWGSDIEDPTDKHLNRAVRALGTAGWWLRLELGPDSFLQAAKGKPGWYTLEHRDGGPDRHFAAESHDLYQLMDAFRSYAAGADDAWRRRHTWTTIEP